MTPSSRLTACWACALVLLLADCASIPTGFEQVPSQTWQHPEQTELGTFFDEFAPADRSLSGVRLISNPREAFRARFGFAALAEKSLDLQYYLWKGDLTGQLLIYRALQAADRGVRVRILTNSIQSNNHTKVHAHYMKYRKRMIEAGIELHELRPDPELLEHYKQVESRVAESHAGLHAKAFVVDGRLSMIGSYNMDPRSRIWNSEIGLLIDSEEFAAKVLEVMEADFDPANSYRLTLNEKGKLEWTAEGPEGPEVWHKEPGTSAWQRFKVRIMSWIPMEKEL